MHTHTSENRKSSEENGMVREKKDATMTMMACEI